MRILIVEDEKRLADTLAQIMLEQKYTVDVVYDGKDGYDYAMSGYYDVVVLDIMLPRMSGYEVVRNLRMEHSSVPVLLLTAKDDIADKVKGLDFGADDYMTKPFSQEELLARVRALARRQGDVVLEELYCGDLTLNLSTSTLHCNAKSLHLGFKEVGVLRMMMVRPGVIATKEDLLLRVWGVDSKAEDNNVEAYISFLRKKLQFLGSTCEIETVRKIGYRIEAK